MKITVMMPELKKGMKSAVLCRWCVEEGQKIEKGTEVFETETEKAVSAVEAEEDMTVLRFLAEEGDEVAVGGPLFEAEVGEK
ncbi:MAG: biotin attachment protein [Clostridia bacterium]|nr:biotin attachment protein [Clostridia bacterium]